MGWYELSTAAAVVLLTVGLGIVVHELTHVIVLHMLGVVYEIEWLPSHEAQDTSHLGIDQAWASVTPQDIPEDLSPWGVRLAAVAPLALVIPGVPIFVGAVADPVAAGNVYVTAAVIAWLAIALPSPQDFSLFWYAGQAIEDFHASSVDGTRE